MAPRCFFACCCYSVEHRCYLLQGSATPALALEGYLFYLSRGNHDNSNPTPAKKTKLTACAELPKTKNLYGSVWHPPAQPPEATVKASNPARASSRRPASNATATSQSKSAPKDSRQCVARDVRIAKVSTYLEVARNANA